MSLKKNYSGFKLEAGCDEAGRGCLAGPVVAAAVILDPGNIHPDLNDSKQISAAKREQLGAWIEQNAIDTAVGLCTAIEIDKINILQASIKAMHRALDDLKFEPKYIIIDGNKFIKYREIRHTCVIKGDSKYASIAAASILAKYYRDRIMLYLHEYHPQYQWNNNKGYPTSMHRSIFIKEGPSPYHRKSFRLKELQASLFDTEQAG
jgi:ribonuclease HII